MMEKKLLEVGDKIKIDTKIFKSWISTIIRVTKTKAVGNIPGNDKGTIEFRREYDDPDFLRPYKYEMWQTNDYTLISKPSANE